MLPRFNWRAVFDSLYDTRVYDNTLAYIFRVVRAFFRYIINQQPLDTYNELLSPDLAINIEETMKARKRKEKKPAEPGELPSVTPEEPVTASTISPTFSVDWKRTDSSKFPVYPDILQKVLNFLNCICLLYNSSFANLCGADNMRVFSVRDLQSAIRKQQVVWNKDHILCLYGDIFNTFDVDAFIGSCYRPRVTSYPTKIIGNRFASVPTSDVNLNFLRVASDGVCQQIIWNLTTRRYEMAAPSLLYLLSLDTSNWSITEAESYPNSRDARASEFTSLVLLHLDEFLDVAQRQDALSMMLYSRLIPKKRIGDSEPKKNDTLVPPVRNNLQSEDQVSDSDCNSPSSSQQDDNIHPKVQVPSDSTFSREGNLFFNFCNLFYFSIFAIWKL